MDAITSDLSIVEENLPPVLDPTAELPHLFDGTIRLYTSYLCPYAQRVWIVRNYKGLQDKIKLVPLALYNRPPWFATKVYTVNKVPVLEHNGKVIGESIDLMKYLDTKFEGPSLLPDDPAKKKLAEELFSYSDKFNGILYTSLRGIIPLEQAGSTLDYLENALKKLEEGPFLLGQFSLVDIAYVPFVERFQIQFSFAFNFDITAGRPKLAAWIQGMNEIRAYKQTKADPTKVVAFQSKQLHPNSTTKSHFTIDILKN